MQKKKQKGCGRKAFKRRTSAIACFCVVFSGSFLLKDQTTQHQRKQ